MKNKNKELEQNIMKRVTRIHHLKKVFNSFTLKVYVILVALVGMSSFISVSNVFRNMPSFLEIGSVYRFMSSAIVNTELLVQFMLGVIIISLVLFIKDTIKNFTYFAKLVKSH